MRLVLLTRSDAEYLAGPIGMSGGRVLPAPIRRWSDGSWDAQHGRDYLAIVGDETVGSDRCDVTSEAASCVAALNRYDDDDECRESANAIREAFAVA